MSYVELFLTTKQVTTSRCWKFHMNSTVNVDHNSNCWKLTRSEKPIETLWRCMNYAWTLPCMGRKEGKLTVEWHQWLKSRFSCYDQTLSERSITKKESNRGMHVSILTCFSFERIGCLWVWILSIGIEVWRGTYSNTKATVWTVGFENALNIVESTENCSLSFNGIGHTIIPQRKKHAHDTSCTDWFPMVQ